MIYRTECWLEMAPQSCKSIVDLPNTRFSAEQNHAAQHNAAAQHPVKFRYAGQDAAFLFRSADIGQPRAVSEVTPSCRAGAAALLPESPALGASATTSSFMVFQLPQLGQRPIQRGLVSPQLEQT